ncbi:cyclic nucleotide-binding domain protein (macronuclear) [Tetrahymena thermophila SB210]|uniref:Cyclic nucleotide-binding domain protein n=1 Tax=Tetrahymena thermophila (strain SB210) TaxID=312017 RepID=Q23KM8_TETTS|nr:cyclic nucleotide-binding domain protein [Tetrahymena thermophila SB210]EAR97091.2 cyclic nucleotide-binding domain protein [Tetrahymena thermophila SB210]|eukprot:XP_001017336.2 cyclic nucleotide-binding domain protein [Tetrahymena thermophila SB210]
MEDDLFQNQNYQKKRIKDSLQESNIQLKKVADHLEESCHSEVLMANQNQIISQENNISQNTQNYQTYENEITPKNPKFKINSSNIGIVQQSLSPIIQTQSLFTHEKEQTSLFNQSQQDRNQDHFDELQMTFNDEQVKKSINQLKMQKDLKERQIISNRSNQKKKDGRAANDQMRMSVLNKNFLIYTNIYQKLRQFFQNKTLSGRTQLLKNKKIQFFINDLSDINNQTSQSQQFTNYFKIFNWITKCNLNLIKDIPTFNPQNQIILSLKIIIFLLNSLFYTYLSLALIFGALIHNIAFQVFFGLWGLEIIIKLNSSIYIKNEHIQNRQTIFKLYFQNEALYDIIPYFLLAITGGFPKNLKLTLQLISFIKTRNIVREFNIIQKQICMNTQKYYNVMQLIDLIFKLFILAHTLSCMWYLVGIIEKTFLDQDTWFDEGFSKQGDWWKIYVQSLYWSLTLMTTGSSLVETPLQAFFACFMMLFTTIIFGYFVSSIGLILAQNDEEKMNHRKDINIINKYMRQRKISKELQRVINLDIEYFYQKNYKKLQEQNQTVLDKLSMNLKEQLLNEYFGSVLNKINCLKSNFSPETLYKVSLQMQEAYYLPNQVFLYEENYESNSLYYIVEGEVELSRKIQEGSNVRQIISKLKKYDEFGHDSFFTGKSNGFQAKAKTFTTVIKLSRESFQSIVKENDKDWQNFNCIKDNILIYNDQKHLKINCSVCQKTQHLTINCPLLHFNRNDYLDKLTYFERIKQNRIKKARKKQKSKNTLINQQLIEEFQLLFQQQNVILTDKNTYIKSQFTSQSELNEIEDRSVNQLSNNELQNQHDLYSREDKTPIITSQFFNVSDSSSSNNNNNNNNNNKGPYSQQKSLTSYTKAFKSYLDFDQENNIQKFPSIEDQMKSPNISKREKDFKNNFQKQDSFKDRNFFSKTNSLDFKTISQYSRAVKSLLEYEQEVPREKEFKQSLFQNQDSFRDRSSTKNITKCNNVDFSLMVQNYQDSMCQNSSKLEGQERQKNEIRQQYPFSIESILERNQNYDKFYNRVQISTYKSFDEHQIYQQLFENPWLFEKQKDFNYYFPEGNCQFVITKYNRFLKRKSKQQQAKIKAKQAN